jgi:TPR repeat protein
MRVPLVVVMCVLPATGEAAGPCPDVTACQTACDGGDAAACARLGEMKQRGLFGDRDLDAAIAAWEKGCAAKKPAVRACLLLAHELYQGSDADAARARKLLEANCKAGDGRSCFNLSEVMNDAEDPQAAIDKMEKRGRQRLDAECKAKKGPSYRSCATLARLVAMGAGGAKQDAKLAKALKARFDKLATAACAAGDVLACDEGAEDEPEVEVYRKGLCAAKARGECKEETP